MAIVFLHTMTGKIDSFTPPLGMVIFKSGAIDQSIEITQSGRHTLEFTTSVTGNYMLIARVNESGFSGGPQTCYIDNVVVREVLETGNTGGNTEAITADLAIFTPDVLSYNDYYPGGMLLPNR